MKFEDLKLPKIVNEHELNMVRDVTARAVYDQMREHYEADKKQPAPEWRLPDPPPGQQWHRTDWTRDMLPEGYRPLLLGEEIDPSQDQMRCEYSDEWSRPAPAKACRIFRHMRTRRPLPAPVEYVPLGPEDVPPGSAVRLISDTDKWQLIIAADPDCAHTNLDFHRWRFLSEHYEILRPGSTTWEPCKKPKA